MPYRVVYARFREAEALLAVRAPRSRIEPVIRAAYQTTKMLGARRLQRGIELLAKRGRLRLGEPTEATSVAEPEAPSPVASLGLQTHAGN